jgi:glycogen operon protein
LLSLVSTLTALRRQYPAFRHPRWFRGHPFHEPGHPFTPGGDIAWLRPDGVAMSDADWDDPWDRSFAYVIEVGEGDSPATERMMVLMHPAHSTLPFMLPGGPWRVALDTSAPQGAAQHAPAGSYELAGPGVCVLVQEIAP